MVGTGFSSDVSSRSFFLSEQGRTEPVLEMEAFLRSMDSDIDPKHPDEHPICRFPARFKWLKKQRLIARDLDELKKCDRYQAWISKGRITSVSVLFASGYFGNPASYFGHALIKFNKEGGGHDILNPTVNYGALTPNQENPFVYIAKGLFGGYNASFTDSSFFYHHHNYLDRELRDLWEYELDLTSQEIELLVDHSWEMLGAHIPYRFISDNCAYRVGELLEIVLNEPVLPRRRPYAIPNDLFYAIGNGVRPNGRELFKNVKFIPSRQHRMTVGYSSRTDLEKKWVKRLIDRQEDLENPDYLPLSEKSKTDILETLFDYYSFRIAKDPGDPVLVERKNRVLLERLNMLADPLHDEPNFNDDRLVPPHASQPSLTTRVGVVKSEMLGEFVELQIRPALYDQLSSVVTHPKDSALEIFDVHLRATKKKLSLSQLTLFSATNLNLSKTDLPGDGGMSWKLKSGLWPQNMSCDDCSVLGVQGGLGAAVEIGESLTAYMMLQGKAQSPRGDDGRLAIGQDVGAFLKLGPLWKVHLNGGYERFVDQRQTQGAYYQVESRLGRGRFWDVRLSFREQVDRRLGVSYSKYW